MCSMEKSDAKEILSNMRHIEKDVWKKRMFLMGLSQSDIYHKKGESHAARCENLQESFLRKDDVFYEDLKTILEKDFGALNTDAGHYTFKGHDHAQFRRVVLNLLDDLSNNGIYRLAEIFTKDSVIHDKTRPRMKRIIKERLKIFQSKQCLADQANIEAQVLELVKNPENFCQNHHKHFDVSLTSELVEEYVGAIKKMSTNTLIAMYNKLHGVRGYMPQLHRPKPSQAGQRLAGRVERLLGKKILQHKLSGIDKLPEPLAKAMDIARLSSKLETGYDLPQVKFVHVTPELEALQNEIFKAIQSLSRRIKPEDKKTLQQLLDPKCKTGDILSPTATKNMLIEFLYECSDMDTIPDNLVEALSVINNMPSNTCKFSSKDRIQDELECVLNVGAHIKQILWDHVSDNNLDQDFSDAYMEELTESDDGDFLDDDDDDDEYDSDDKLKLFTNTSHEVQVRLNFNDCNEEVESTGDAADEEYYCSQEDDVKNTNKYSSSSFGTARVLDDNDDVCMNTKASSSEMLISTVSGTSHLDPNILEQYGNVKEMDRNRYVALQEVSDRASLAAYQLIEHMMDQCGKTEALPTCSRSKKSVESMGKDASRLVIIQAAREVMPSFPISELEKVDKFMSL